MFFETVSLNLYWKDFEKVTYDLHTYLFRDSKPQ